MKITIRLRPDRDDDIKDWYEDLPRGDRSRIIRDVLKEFICHRHTSNGHLSKCNFSDSNQVQVDIKHNGIEYDMDEENIEERLNSLLNQV